MMKKMRGKWTAFGRKGLVCLLALVLVAGLCVSYIMPKAEAAVGGEYSGNVVYYYYATADGQSRWLTVEAGTKMELTDIIRLLEIPYDVSVRYPHQDNVNFGATALNGIGDALVGYEYKDGKTYFNPFSGPYGTNDNALLEILWADKVTGANAKFSVFTNHYVQKFNKYYSTLCLMYQDDHFYIWDEGKNVALSGALPYKTMEDAINGAFGISTYANANFGYLNVKILMNDTYKAVNKSLVYPGTANPVETWYGPSVDGIGNYQATIERYDGFTGTLVEVEAHGNGPLLIDERVTIDNKSPAGSNLTAVKVQNYTAGQAGMVILRRGSIIDSNAIADGNYRGTGVLVTSKTHDPENASELITTDGGVLELDTRCRIEGFYYGVDQRYGVTRLKDIYQQGGIDVIKNTYSIRLYRHNYIGKWDRLTEFPAISVQLHNVDKWQSGDLIYTSGYWWVKGDSSVATNLRWSPVTQDDVDVFDVEITNSGGLTSALGVGYYNPHNEGQNFTGVDGTYAGNYNIVDPYPVLRFTKLSVYNVNQKTWHFTLGEAVAASKAGDELVFYDNTQESGTIEINHDLTIRSAYTGEQSYASVSGDEPIVDNRGGKNYTATWISTSAGSGIAIKNGATVTFTGTADGKTCGTLTLDANEQGRVVENQGTMNMHAGITLTGGDEPQGGGIYNNTTGVLNLDGGSIVDNKSSDGLSDSIYQAGEFYVKGNPVIDGTVHLPSTCVTDGANQNDDNGNHVVTKDGEFTTGFSGFKITLGGAQYNGRDIVVSRGGTVTDANEHDNYFVQGTKMITVLDEGVAYVYTAQDTHSGNPVLELTKDTCSVEVTKTVVGKDYTTDGFAFTATLTNKSGQAIAFPAQTDSKITRSSDGMQLTFKLKHGESVEIIELVPDWEVTVVETADDRYTCDNATKTTKAAVGDEDNITFTNTLKTGTVKVKKVVSGWSAPDQEFTFELLLLKGDGTYWEIPNDASVMVDGQDVHWVGSGTGEESAQGWYFKLKDGQTATISGLPQGVAMWIEEQPVPSEYTVSNKVSNNAGSGSGKDHYWPAINEDNGTVTFTNTRKTGSVEVTKTVVNGLDANEAFTFTATLKYNGNTYNFTGKEKMKIGDAETVIPAGSSYSFQLKGGQTATFSGLPIGTTLFVEEAANGNYDTAIAVNSTSVTKENAYVAVTAGTAQQITFTNTRKTGTVKVTKKVVGDAVGPFDFTAVLKLAGSDQTVNFPSGVKLKINGANATTTANGSQWQFQLSNGYEAVFENLPVGTQVVVTETVSAEEYLTNVNTTSDQHGVTGTAVVDANNPVTLAYTNTVLKKYTTVTVTKNVDGNLGDWSKSFSFDVTYTGRDGAETESFTLKHGETKSFEVLIGSEFAVTENPDGYTMTAALNGAAVTVANNTVEIPVEEQKAYGLVVNNNLNQQLDTGISLDSLPYILIIAIVVAGGLFLFLRKRKNAED